MICPKVLQTVKKSGENKQKMAFSDNSAEAGHWCARLMMKSPFNHHCLQRLFWSYTAQQVHREYFGAYYNHKIHLCLFLKGLIFGKLCFRCIINGLYNKPIKGSKLLQDTDGHIRKEGMHVFSKSMDESKRGRGEGCRRNIWILIMVWYQSRPILVLIRKNNTVLPITDKNIYDSSPQG